jgi:hypothetical protein
MANQAEKNVASVERWGSLLAGAMGLGWALRHAGRTMREARRSGRYGSARGATARAGALSALGGATALGLVWRGATGHCAVYERLGVDTHALAERHRVGATAQPLERAVLINKPLAEVRDLLRGGRLAEIAGADGAEPGADAAPITGHFADRDWSLALAPAFHDQQTRLSAHTDDGPAGAIASRALAALVDAELRRVKALVETGEVATIEGQSHGERGMLGRAAERLADVAKTAAARIAGPASDYDEPSEQEARPSPAPRTADGDRTPGTRVDLDSGEVHV